MLPSTTPPAADHRHHHHHAARKLKKLELKTTFHSIKSHISGHHCAWLTATVLLQLSVVLFLLRASPPPPPSSVNRGHFESSCKYGRIYVYDLPSTLNRDLIANCHDLDPWSSRCNAISNSGFGPPAVGLDGVVPQNLTAAWYWTDMYAAEVIYHDRITNYHCTTTNPNEATAFYIPFYAGLAVGKYLWFNYTSKDRDRHAVEMLNWVENQAPFKKSNGSDHFVVLGRLTWDFRRLTDKDDDWGTRLILMPSMKNILRLSVEKSQWDGLEVSIPYPTAFHPRSESDIRHWQEFTRTRIRTSSFTFVGATRKKIRNDFRGLLMDYCKNESDSCRVVDCSVTRCYDGAPGILQAFLDSDFCFQPKGDGYTRRSAFDCMLAGSVPVFFWKRSFEYQYEWHLPEEWGSFSVFIDNNDVRNDVSVIKRVLLEKYSQEDVKRMREKIIEFLPRILYRRYGGTSPGRVVDAFDISMEGVLRRFHKQHKVVVEKLRLD